MEENQFLKSLRAFLCEAKKKGYAVGDKATIRLESNGSKTIRYEKGLWKYEDNYFGGNPFGGREIVLFTGKPFLIINYYGSILKPHSRDKEKVELISSFLRKALCNVIEERPFRGPFEYGKDKMVYFDKSTGDISDFYGKEIIYDGPDNLVYEAHYRGGFICQD